MSKRLQYLAPGKLPFGIRIYAIGDIHGCAAKLAVLLKAIAAHAEANPVKRPIIVYLGDYIDRGPESSRVVDAVMHHVQNGNGQVIALRGNHEQMLLDAVDDPSCLGHWLANGGAATLSSYDQKGAGLEAAQEQIPESHIAFIRALPLSYKADGYFFAHAGVLPGAPLETQDPEHLLWIREPFLAWPDGSEIEMPVVHGHTPSPGVTVLPHRIGIDTGAVFGGPLSCVVLEDETIEVIQV